MNWLALFLGIVLFIHYGCAVVRHDSKRSSFPIMFALTAIMIADVLILRAAINGIIDGVYYLHDMCVGLLIFGYAKTFKSMYLWHFNITYVRHALEIYQQGGFSFKKFLERIKNSL